ncbi:MAG: hypothetical protein A2V88_08605 [Elusimicrobia bacterium RBG_16_66_12]|nr:MAG: hypothetical protein A2V88_08605 [Elusimicrobia bacterium RBG_16_66_12]
MMPLQAALTLARGAWLEPAPATAATAIFRTISPAEAAASAEPFRCSRRRSLASFSKSNCSTAGL